MSYNYKYQESKQLLFECSRRQKRYKTPRLNIEIVRQKRGSKNLIPLFCIKKLKTKEGIEI